MGVEMIPAECRFVCDRCGEERAGDLKDKQPTGWAWLHLQHGSGGARWLLCGLCFPFIADLLGRYIPSRSATDG